LDLRLLLAAATTIPAARIVAAGHCPAYDPADGERGRIRAAPGATAIARHPRRWLVLAAWVAGAWGAILLVLGAWAIHDAGQAADELRRIREELVSVDPEKPAPDLDRLTLELAREGRELASANNRLHGPWWAPAGLIPVVSTQLDSARALTNAGEIASKATSRAVREADELRDRTAIGDGESLAPALAGLETIAHRLVGELDPVGVGPGGPLLPFLRTARADFTEELEIARDGSGRLEIVTRELAAVIKGPRRYVLIPAANAEMRAGMGSFLRAAPLTIRNGRIELGPVAATDELGVEIPPGAVELGDADFKRMWGWLNGNRTLSTLGTSPRFPASAEVAADAYEFVTKAPVDGVIALDVATIVGLLGVTGPVTIDGVRFDADNAVEELNRRQYEVPERDARVATQAKLAAATLETLLSGDVDVLRVTRSLAGAAQARHLLVWSRDKAEQTAWRELGIAGELRDNSVLLSAINIGNTKLDPYLELRAEMFAQPTFEGPNVTVRIAAENTADGNEADTVGGHAVQFGNPRSTYFGMLTLHVPGEATNVSIDGDARISAIGPDGPSKVMGTWLELVPGASSTTTIRFHLPASMSELRVEPSARMPGVAWKAGSEAWVDARATTVDVGLVAPLLERPATSWTADRPGFEARLAQVRTALGPLADVDVDALAAFAVSPEFRTRPTANAERLPDSPLRGAKISVLMQLLIERRLIGLTAPAYGVTVPPTIPLPGARSGR
jgi:hypothetical protein